MHNLIHRAQYFSQLGAVFILLLSATSLKAQKVPHCRFSLDEMQVYAVAKKPEYEARVKDFVNRLKAFEKEVSTGLFTGKALPQDYVERSDAFVEEAADLFKELGEEVHLVKEKMSLHNNSFVVNEGFQGEIEYLRISLGEIDALDRTSLRALERLITRFRLNEVSIDIFKNMIQSTGGYFQGSSAYVSLGVISVDRLLKWNSRDFVMSHELTHAKKEANRRSKKEIFESYKNFVEKSPLQTAITNKDNRLLSVQEKQEKLAFQTKIMDSAMETDMRYKGQQIYSTRFHALHKPFIQDALYSRYMSAEELYTFANNIWWSISAFKEPAKLTGAELVDLVNNWYGLVSSLENVARQTNTASKVFIETIQKLENVDIDTILEHYIGLSEKGEVFYIQSYQNNNLKSPEFLMGKNFYEGEAISEILGEYIKRWPRNQAVLNASASMQDSLPVSRIVMSKEIDKQAVENLVRKQLSASLEDLVQLERISAFYLVEVNKFEKSFRTFVRLLSEEGSFTQASLNNNSVHIWNVFKSYARQLGLWVRPSYKDFVGDKEQYVDRDLVQAHLKRVQTKLDKSNKNPTIKPKKE